MALPAVSPVPPRCPNCDAAMAGRYCASCGQDNRASDVRLVDLGGDLVGAVVSVESRLWRTLRELTLDPGGVARRYAEGQRARYVSPLRYAVSTAALWWFVLSFAIPDNIDELAAEHPVGVVVLLYGQLLNLVAAPALGLVIALGFLGSGRSVLHQVVLSLYACGHVFLWRAGLTTMGLVLPESAAPIAAYTDFAFFTLYFAFALWGAHRGLVRWLPVRVIATLFGMYYASTFLVGFLAGVISAWSAE